MSCAALSVPTAAAAAADDVFGPRHILYKHQFVLWSGQKKFSLQSPPSSYSPSHVSLRVDFGGMSNDDFMGL